jgi:hypothetical protein
MVDVQSRYHSSQIDECLNWTEWLRLLQQEDILGLSGGGSFCSG